MFKSLKRAWREQRGAVNTTLITMVIMAGVAFVILGISLSIGGPALLSGFEAIRTDTAAGNYTSLNTVVAAGPTLIVLGLLIAVAIVGFLGIKMAKGKGD